MKNIIYWWTYCNYLQVSRYTV